MTSTDARPARGTRPPNRRELILEAAAELFYRDSYAAVGMSDIADAVAIGPSALYRHFSSKRDLLAAVVIRSVDRLAAELAEVDEADLTAVLARAALDQRRAGMTWRREVRYLSDSARTEFRERLRAVRGRTADLISAHRPDLDRAGAMLAARCVLAVVASVSFHNVQLSDAELIENLRRMIAATVASDYAPLTTDLGPGTRGIERSVVSRREEILSASAELFSSKGFSNVGMEDIGSRVGIAGPSIYNHFESKAEILHAVLMRGNEWLRFGLSRALAEATDEADALTRLLTSYIDFGIAQPQFVQLLLTEVVELPDPLRARSREVQREYIAEWVHLLRTVVPELDPSGARLRVQAAIHIVNEVSLGRSRNAVGVRKVLSAVGLAVLHA